MGMFDDIDYECKCPRCGGTVSGFQTKDGDCVLERLKPTQVNNFYASCPDCSAWIEFERVIQPTENFRMSWSSVNGVRLDSKDVEITAEEH